jgi:hypothetical protein
VSKSARKPAAGRGRGRGSPDEMWWRAPEGEAHDWVFRQVRRMEMLQSDLFERFHKLEILYDPFSPLVTDSPENRRGAVQENAIASNIDTVHAIISTADIEVRFETDGADWEQQRRARHLEWYADEQKQKLHVLKHCRGGFKESAKKGNGLVKVEEKFGRPWVQQVMVENFVVDAWETRDGKAPTHCHEWVSCDADELVARFPRYEDEIYKARSMRQSWRIDGRYTPLYDNSVIYLDSYRLSTGVKGETGYAPGRHVISIQGYTLLDEPWEDDFPYAVIVWTERAKSWYGISGAERIAGIQRALNRRNWHIEKQNDLIALPTTFVRPADANFGVKTSKIGAVAVIKGDYPETISPQAVGKETYQSRIDLRNSAGEEFGQSSMATRGAKPPGLDSGAALREFKDQTTDRFGPQEKAFEQLVIDVLALVIKVCKKLGDKAPTMIRHSRFGPRRIKWKDVDMGEVRVQMHVASDLPQTPAGRKQFVLELAQAGIVSTDSATRMLQMPDVEAELSLYTAALEACEQCMDEIADGKTIMPEPYMNLSMCVWRGQRELLKWEGDGAPEDRLETLRQFVNQAAWMSNPQAANQNMDQAAASLNAPPANTNAPGAPPAAGQGPAPFMANQPGGGTPAAALAAPAMNLVAGHG